MAYCLPSDVSEEIQLPWEDAQELDQDAASTSISVADTEDHVFAVGDEIELKNDNGYSEQTTISAITYNDSGHHTITVPALTDETKFTTALGATIQIMSFFSALTIPSSSTVAEWISQAEQKIDDYLNKSFKNTNEFEGYLPYEPVKWRATWDLSTRWAVPLPFNDPVVDLDSAQGDYLKIWNGTEEHDYTDEWTQGRGDDYWFDDGFLFVRTYRPRKGRYSIKLKCRHGESSVPGNVKEACIKWVAKRVRTGDIRNRSGGELRNAAGGGGESWPYQNYITWTEIKSILNQGDKDIICGA